MRRALVLLVAAIVAMSGCGGGGTIGSVTAVTVTPKTSSVLPGGTKQFNVTQNVLIDWSAPDGGTVTDGLFTAPITQGTYHVVATSVLNPTISDTATVTVSSVEVTVTPSTLSVSKGTSLSNAFTALVAGTANKAVTWTLNQAAAGTISASTPDANGNARVNFTAGTQAGIFTIRATSSADPSVSETAQINVLGANSLALNPQNASVTTTAGTNTVTFTAILTNGSGAIDSTTPLIWDIPSNPAGASLSGSGLRQRTFTAPTSFIGTATCQVRVRTSGGVAMVATVRVSSN